MKRLLGKIFKRKKVVEPKSEPPTERGWEMEPDSIDGDDNFIELPEPSPERPPIRVIKEGVEIVKPLQKPRKKAKKKPITTKKRSENKMPLPEIVYEYYQCKCEDWQKHLPQIVEQQQFAVSRGRKEGVNMAFDMKPFVFCPWCGWKRYRSNRGKKANQ